MVGGQDEVREQAAQAEVGAVERVGQNPSHRQPGIEPIGQHRAGVVAIAVSSGTCAFARRAPSSAQPRSR